eukprot:CAMPEP_0119133974 /NCGR_PEP_ID=MMETSP1310-20130426/14951_1 /TAXON_ID=464262 /ORGANISM="Genus nov. species nov., Strain RCC2339" /LENGTH=109 /DNA_ID=CAMNT_0007124711 /DNA_START=82 /DNA_END=407 /DNA_ORIENTATION=-
MASSQAEAARIRRLQEEREKAKRDAEAQRKKIKEDNRLKGMEGKFASTLSERAEEDFKTQTVGLVTADEFRKKRKRVYDEQEARKEEAARKAKKGKKKKKTKAAAAAVL